MKWTTEQLESWIDRHAIDKDGHKIGAIADVYIDDGTGEPEWLAIMTGFFGSRISFVPLVGAKETANDVQVAYEKSIVKDSPNIEANGELSEEEESRLYRHYGFAYKSNKPASETIVDADQGAQQDLSETGSASVKAEISADVARTRLRRRDAAAVGAIDLDADEGDVAAPAPERNRSREERAKR